MNRRLVNLLYIILCDPTHCYIASSIGRTSYSRRCDPVKVHADNAGDLNTAAFTRRDIISAIPLSFLIASTAPASAATRESLDDLLYRILRVREATTMETRLIKSGKFKDLQRANIKLAVRFMVDNYRLNDAFLAASTYLDGTSRRLEASQLGQAATQNLITILEYFDASDVDNLKVMYDMHYSEYMQFKISDAF